MAVLVRDMCSLLHTSQAFQGCCGLFVFPHLFFLLKNHLFSPLPSCSFSRIGIGQLSLSPSCLVWLKGEIVYIQPLSLNSHPLFSREKGKTQEDMLN